jgi:predicted metal-dependent hydrolase
MTQTHIRLGGLEIAVTFKAVKHVHLSVHPPQGKVTLVAPTGTRLEVARAYAISKLRWIRQQQEQLLAQARETPRRFVTRESHYIWGRRYLLAVVEQDAPPSVKMDHRRITLNVRPGTDPSRREAIFQAWQRSLLHDAIPPLIARWEQQIGVKVAGYFLQRMKTKWGSCNHRRAHIRLNTELVKKPRDLLEYVIVHEMIHLIEPTHSDHFIALLDQHYPAWREARAELNALPLGQVA